MSIWLPANHVTSAFTEKLAKVSQSRPLAVIVIKSKRQAGLAGAIITCEQQREIILPHFCGEIYLYLPWHTHDARGEASPWQEPADNPRIVVAGDFYYVFLGEFDTPRPVLAVLADLDAYITEPANLFNPALFAETWQAHQLSGQTSLLVVFGTQGGVITRHTDPKLTVIRPRKQAIKIMACFNPSHLLYPASNIKQNAQMNTCLISYIPVNSTRILSGIKKWHDTLTPY